MVRVFVDFVKLVIHSHSFYFGIRVIDGSFFLLGS